MTSKDKKGNMVLDTSKNDDRSQSPNPNSNKVTILNKAPTLKKGESGKPPQVCYRSLNCEGV